MEEKFEDVKILLCEDDENLGMLLREYLEAKGFQVDLCVDGEEGYDTFCSNKYDLCILDVMMPKMDGFTLAGKIRELNAEVPFIFLTAKTLIEDIRAGFEIGADDYITKPFRMDVVVLRIEAIQAEQKRDHPFDWQVHLRHAKADADHRWRREKAYDQRSRAADPAEQQNQRVASS